MGQKGIQQLILGDIGGDLAPKSRDFPDFDSTFLAAEGRGEASSHAGLKLD